MISNIKKTPSSPSVTRNKAASHESELAKLEEQSKKKMAAAAARKKKEEDKKKRDEEARIHLENREKEKKIIEDEENKAIEEEDKRIRDITKAIAMELDGDDEVKTKLFENDDPTSEVNTSSPAYKKTKGTTSVLKSTTRYGPASTPATRKPTKKVATLQKHAFFVDIGITLKMEDKATEWRSKIPLILVNAQLLDENAGFVELRPVDKNQPRITYHHREK
jgi:hypothetical protein